MVINWSCLYNYHLSFYIRYFLYLFPPEPEFKIEEVGEPLHLTPYIKANRIAEARDRAQVRGLQWPGNCKHVSQGKSR